MGRNEQRKPMDALMNGDRQTPGNGYKSECGGEPDDRPLAMRPAPVTADGRHMDGKDAGGNTRNMPTSSGTGTPDVPDGRQGSIAAPLVVGATDNCERDWAERGWRAMTASDPIAAIRMAHKEQLALCDCLESIADGLPNTNHQRCIYAAKVIGPLTVDLHRFEEAALYPQIVRTLGASPELSQTLQRLKFEHCEDECFTEELTEVLLALGRDEPGLNIEAVGYMLRGFFSNMRRHIAFEQDHLLALLDKA